MVTTLDTFSGLGTLTPSPDASGMKVNPGSSCAITGPGVRAFEYIASTNREFWYAHIDRALNVGWSPRQLAAVANELVIGRDSAARLHAEYLDQLATVAWADGVLSATEVADLAAVAALLQVPDALLTAALAPRASAEVTSTTDAAPTPSPFTLPPGATVVLTGEMSRPRAELAEVLASFAA